MLATGSSDMANRLGLRVERLPWLKHTLPDLEASLERLTDQERRRMKPVLIVGAGLSAADAVTICRQSGIPVVHVYRSRTAGLDKMLPQNVYPEYHEVHRMMKDPSQTYPYYTPVPEHAIVDLHPAPLALGNHRVRVRHLVTGEMKDLEVSFCAVLIGARPDLRFVHAASLLSQPTDKVEPLAERNVRICGEKGPNGGSVDCYIEEECCPENILPPLEESVRVSRLTQWLKVFCAKCRHMNAIGGEQRGRGQRDYKRICGTGNNNQSAIKCECPQGLKLKENGSIKMMAMAAKIDDGALGLGEDPSKPIDGKSNPIAVDKFTNQVLRAGQGLFAIGPLVGDNFVRFIAGGALAVTAALHKRKVSE